MKNKNMVIVIVLAAIVIIGGAIFIFGRNKVDGVTGVSTEIYNNGMRIVELLKNNEISTPDATSIFNEEWSSELSYGLMTYRNSLYDISADTDEEIEYLATIYYALCSKYYENLMDIIINSEYNNYIDYIDVYDAQSLKDEFTSDYNDAINAIESKDIETMRNVINGIDVERSVDKFADYYSATFGEIFSDAGNYSFSSDLFGLGEDSYSSGLGENNFSLQ